MLMLFIGLGIGFVWGALAVFVGVALGHAAKTGDIVQAAHERHLHAVKGGES